MIELEETQIKSYKRRVLPAVPRANSVYYILPQGSSNVIVYITDKAGFPIKVIDLSGSGASGVNSVTGTGVTGTNDNPQINIATFLSTEINNRLRLSLQDGKLFVEQLVSTDGSIEINDNVIQLSTAIQNTLLDIQNDILILQTDVNQLETNKFDIPIGTIDQYLDGEGTPKSFPPPTAGITNLGYIPSPTQGIVTSDTGTNAPIPLTDAINAGLQTAQEKTLTLSAVQPEDLATVATTGEYSDLENIPTTFPPSSHTHSISEVIGLQTELDSKVDENAPITAATKTKIQYDSKGLVIAGTDATTLDVNDATNRRYVTDAEKTVIANTSGTNSGDITKTGENYLVLTGQVLSANPINLSNTNVTGALPIGNGGTGSSSQNFVDLSNPQTIGGVKTFSSNILAPNVDATNKTDIAAKETALIITSVKTANYSIVVNEFVPFNLTGNYVATLPTAPPTGTKVGMKIVALTGVNTLTINAGGSDVFNVTGGLNTVSLSVLNQVIVLQYKSGIWYATDTSISKTYIDTQDALKAPIASPTFTGTPSAPTPTTGTFGTRLATTQFIRDNASYYLPSSTATEVNASLSAVRVLVSALLIDTNETRLTTVMDYEVEIFKPNTDGTGTFFFYTNTSPTLNGSEQQIGMLTFAAAARWFSFQKRMRIETTGLVFGNTGAVSAVTNIGLTLNSTGGATGYTSTGQNYLLFASTSASATNIVTQKSAMIKIVKY